MSTPSCSDLLSTPPKALTFDVFGTVVNWRQTITKTLISSARSKTSSSSQSSTLSPETLTVLSKTTDSDWGRFAQEWRNSYKKFVAGYRPDRDVWRDIDAHHLASLRSLLSEWQLAELYGEDELFDLSRTWHFLDPWVDSSRGIGLLSRRFVTSTLSNGNRSLLKDLDEFGSLGFAVLQSGEDFGAYKPHPSVYLGAAGRLGFEPGQVAMVAAHLDDLKAARDQGFKTIYVERPREEDWPVDGDDYRDAKRWVDMWVIEEEDGFVEVARRFGIC